MEIALFTGRFAMPPLTNSKGLHTNAVYGFTTMLLRLLEEHKPTHVMVAFDAGKVTFRHEGYQEYKGGREKHHLSCRNSFHYSKNCCKDWVLPSLSWPGLKRTISLER